MLAAVLAEWAALGDQALTARLVAHRGWHVTSRRPDETGEFEGAVVELTPHDCRWQLPCSNTRAGRTMRCPPSAEVLMPFDIFAKIGDIKGESQDDKHNGEIE